MAKPIKKADPFEDLDSPTSSQVITKSAADATLEKITQDRKLPPAPGSNVPFDDMIKWLQALTTKQFERLSIYIYRWKPVIDLRKDDPTNTTNIDKPSEIPTYDYMVRIHGGGTYGFKIKDTDADKLYFESKLEIPLSQHTPIIDLNTLVIDHKDNRQYVAMLKNQGRLDSTGKVIDEIKEVKQPVGLDPNGLVDKLFSTLTEQQKAQMEDLKRTVRDQKAETSSNTQLLVEMMKANDPTKTIAAVISMLPKPQSNDSSMAIIMPLIIKMMEAQQASSQQFMTLMLQQINKPEAPTPYKDPFAFMEKAVTFFESRLANKSGGNSEETTTDKIIGAVERIGLPLVEVFMNAANAKRAIETGNPVPTMKPVTQIPQAPEMVNVNPFTSIPTSTPQFQGNIQELTDLLRQFQSIIINVVSNKVTGDEFAQQLEDQFTMPVVNRIIAFGPEGIVAAMQSIPELWSVIAPTENDAGIIREFAEDFCNYKHIQASKGE